MLFFQQLAFLDPYELACSLRPRLAQFGESDAHGRREMPIRWHGENGDWTRIKLSKWPELANMLARIEQIGTAIAGPLDRGHIFFEMLDPGATLPWHREDIGDWWRLHMAIRTNPGCMMFAGGEAVNIMPGQVVRVGTGALSSALNAGEWPRVHLVMDFRREIPG